jgi:choline kinase
MLLRCLAQLEKAGITKATVVVGYLEQVIRDAVGTRFGAMDIEYVSNPDYATTNNLYSLFLAKPVLDDDILLIEADLLFDDALFSSLLATTGKDVAVVDKYGPGMDGTVVLTKSAGFDYASAWKTVNVYKLSKAFMLEGFFPEAARWVSEKRTDQYYEAVIAALVDKGAPLSVFRMNGLRWSEVDDTDDLARAERVFPRS